MLLSIYLGKARNYLSTGYNQMASIVPLQSQRLSIAFYNDPFESLQRFIL